MRFKSLNFKVLSLELSSGFTLMELMVVMAIMGILITVGLSSYKSVQMKSRDARRKNDLRSIAGALDLYYNDKGRYPGDDGAGNIMGCGTGDSQMCTWGAAMRDSKNTLYMVTLPSDPASGRRYYYDSQGSQGKGFQLYARLENSEDIDLSRDERGNVYFYTGTVCIPATSKKCNYGVASANLALDDAGQGHTKTVTD